MINSSSIKRLKSLLGLVTLAAHATTTLAQVDLLEGNGKFVQENLENWKSISPDSYDIQIIPNEIGDSPHLEITKKENASGFFDDGLFYLFSQDEQPRHVTFQVNTGSFELESCDIRLTNLKKTVDERLLDELQEEGELQNAPTKAEQEEQAEEVAEEQNEQVEVVVPKPPSGPADYEKIPFTDILFFRFGYYNYMKLNTESMVKKFEADSWYQVDMLVDWFNQKVSIYIDEEPLSVQPFFTKRKEKIKSINAVSIYGLAPGSVSRFRELRICDDICSGSASNLADISGAITNMVTSSMFCLLALLLVS